jgi:O-antigen ligase
MEFLLGTVFVGLSLIMLPAAADPYQPVRALVAGCVVALAGIVLGRRRISAGLRVPAILAGALAATYLVAAITGGLASSVFGVHGRFQGLVAGALYLCAGAVGVIAFRRNVFALVWPLATVASVHSVVIVFQRLLGAVPASTMGNQVLAGGWLAIATSTVLAAAIVSSGRKRVLLGVAAAFAALGVGMSGSRGAWFGLAVAVLAAAFVLRSRRSWAILSAVAAGALIGAALLGGPAALSKLDPSSLSSGSAASRWQIWRGSGRLIAAHPVVGVGPGRFLYEFPRYEPFQRAALEYGDVRADQAHSELLQVAAESGIPAALLLLALLGLAVTRGARAARAKDGVAFVAFVGLCAAAGQGVFGITTVETGVLAWTLGGIAVSRSVVGSGGRDHRSDSGTALPVWARAILTLAGGCIMLASGVYLVADGDYFRGLEQFAAGQLEVAVREHHAAERLVPIVDTFRVAEADAALYLGGANLDDALRSIDVGLSFEPDSYDLALARARTLRGLNRPASEVADAYVRSVELYPLGIEVRAEAVQLLYAANRNEEAASMQRDLVRLQEAAERGPTP